MNRWKSLSDSRNSQKQSKSTRKRRKTKKPQVPDRTRNCTATHSARVQEGGRPRRPHDSSRRWLQKEETLFALVCCAFQRFRVLATIYDTQSTRSLGESVGDSRNLHAILGLSVYRFRC